AHEARLDVDTACTDAMQWTYRRSGVTSFSAPGTLFFTRGANVCETNPIPSCIGRMGGGARSPPLVTTPASRPGGSHEADDFRIHEPLCRFSARPAVGNMEGPGDAPRAQHGLPHRLPRSRR